MPAGRFVGFSGDSGTGKTLIVNKILGIAQKNGITPVIWDTETAVDEKSAVSIGLDPTRTKYMPVQTVTDCRNQISKFLDRVIENKLYGKFIISIDSLGNLCSSKELADISDGKDAQDMGLRAKQLKSLFRTLTYKAAKAGVTILFTNHTYADPGQMYPSLIKIQSGGTGAVYMSSVLVQLAKRNEKEGEGEFGGIEEHKLTEANKYSGCTLRALTTKNRFVPQFLETEIYLSFTNGLNRYSGLLAMAEARGIVVKDGHRHNAGITFGKYTAGDSLGFAKNFTKDSLFFEDYLIPLLDEKLKKDYAYYQETLPATDPDLIADTTEE